MMPRADDIIIEKVIHNTQTVYVHAIMSRTTVAGECLLNIDQHTAARGLKLNMYHNSATLPVRSPHSNKMFRNKFYFANFKLCFLLALIVKITLTVATIKLIFFIKALIQDHTVKKMTPLVMHICHKQNALFSE